MKIERPRHLQKLLERSLETGDAAPLQEALQTTPAAELETFLSSVDAHKRRHVEKLLGREAPLTSGVSAASGAVVGKSVLALRAQKQDPWWKAVQPDARLLVGAPIHPEPPRDIDVHGERFTKDDVASLLRNIGR